MDNARVQHTWVLRINMNEAPALFQRIRERNDLRLGELSRGAITLMIRRNQRPLLLPVDDELLQTNDELLMYGSRGQRLAVMDFAEAFVGN